jgi:hypothetical protein
MRVSSFASLGFSCLMLLSAGAARAQGRAAAEALFNQGREAMTAKDYEAACTRFRESDRIDPAAGTRFNLAFCEEARGKLATAWELFRGVAEQLPRNDERLPIARQRVQALEPRLPRLTLRLAPGAPRDTKVSGADVELGADGFGVPLPMDPGKHLLVASAQGRARASFEIALVEGQKAELEIAPGPALPVEREAPARSGPASVAVPVAGPREAAKNPDRSGDASRTLGYVLGALGVAGVGVGAVTGVMMLEKKAVRDDHCDAVSCDQEGLDANSAGRTFRTVSAVSWVVGAVGIGAGAYLILSSDARGSAETTLATSFGSKQAALSLAGRF